jgi:hypothetical protein
MRRCKSTKLVRGHVIRCEAEQDHMCAHFAENSWWPNYYGLPVKKRAPATPHELPGLFFLFLIGIVSVLCFFIFIR